MPANPAHAQVNREIPDLAASTVLPAAAAVRAADLSPSHTGSTVRFTLARGLGLKEFQGTLVSAAPCADGVELIIAPLNHVVRSAGNGSVWGPVMAPFLELPRPDGNSRYLVAPDTAVSLPTAAETAKDRYEILTQDPRLEGPGRWPHRGV